MTDYSDFEVYERSEHDEGQERYTDFMREAYNKGYHGIFQTRYAEAAMTEAGWGWTLGRGWTTDWER